MFSQTTNSTPFLSTNPIYLTHWVQYHTVMKKDAPQNQKITNQKAFYEYEIQDRLEVGINLYGFEVKAVRMGHADLSGSFVKVYRGYQVQKSYRFYLAVKEELLTQSV